MFFSTNGRPDTQGVYLGSLDGGEPIRVLATETPAVFVPPDRVLLVRGDALMAARFDAAQGTVVGELMSLAQPVGRDDGVVGQRLLRVAGDARVSSHGRQPAEATRLDGSHRKDGGLDRLTRDQPTRTAGPGSGRPAHRD